MTELTAHPHVEPGETLTDDPSRARRLAPVVFRSVVTLHALAVFAQPVLAGRFLNGDFEMLAVHRTVGVLAGVLAIVQFPVAVVHRRSCRGPAWPVRACLGLAIADSVQIFLGFDREIGLHVPLGVAIVSGTLLLVISAWRDGIGAPAPGGSA